MKALAIIALLFGLGAVGASVYAFVETKPNYDYNKKEAEESAGGTDRISELNQLVFDDYNKALGREVVGAWGGGFLALVLGGIATRSRPGRALGIIAIIVGLAGAGLAFAVMPQPLVL